MSGCRSDEQSSLGAGRLLESSQQNAINECYGLRVRGRGEQGDGQADVGGLCERVEGQHLSSPNP